MYRCRKKCDNLKQVDNTIAKDTETLSYYSLK